MKPAYRVHLIVDRAFAGGLDIIPRPIWIADTPANRLAIEEAWKQEGTDTHLYGVTCYQPRSDEEIAEEILDLLSTLEEHHGIFSHDPPMDALKIYGFSKAPLIADTLEELGFRLSASDNDSCEFQK